MTTAAVERIPRTLSQEERRGGRGGGGGGVKIPFHPGRDIANDWNSAQEREEEDSHDELVYARSRRISVVSIPLHSSGFFSIGEIGR